jgi:hypothetical protein
MGNANRMWSGKIGIQRTDLFRTGGMNESFGIWENCMNTFRSGNMHYKNKIQEMNKGEKSRKMEI